MNSRLYSNREPQQPRINMNKTLTLLPVLLFFAFCSLARANDAPQWMHALVNVPLPEHDEKTDAVLLYSEKIVTVQSADKIKTTVREAYKILRPSGRDA